LKLAGGAESVDGVAIRKRSAEEAHRLYTRAWEAFSDLIAARGTNTWAEQGAFEIVHALALALARPGPLPADVVKLIQGATKALGSWGTPGSEVYRARLVTEFEVGTDGEFRERLRAHHPKLAEVPDDSFGRALEEGSPALQAAHLALAAGVEDRGEGETFAKAVVRLANVYRNAHRKHT
jgi:hypothetical protein